MNSMETAQRPDTLELVLLGATGSIGTQALEVVDSLRAQGHAVNVRALGAGGSRLELLADQALTYRPELIAVAGAEESAVRDALAAARVRAENGADSVAADGAASHLEDYAPQILTGPDAMTHAAALLSAPDAATARVVLNGITGSVGLAPTLAALRSGATLALANKESLVVGGSLVQRAQQRPGQVVPVDSEHSAMAQSLLSGRHERGMTSPVVTGHSEVRRLILTASGGPFRGWTREQLAQVTPQQALNHPTWSMGPVVTTNSSTLVNKGLELIEASLLFDIAPSDITVVVHPQSVVHSMVEFVDGSTIAQASPPDMRLPIALGMTWPVREPLGETLIAPCRWAEPTQWTFEPVDEAVFPAVRIAREVAAASPLHPAVFNAANEQCVDAFLSSRLPYLGIIDVVQATLDAFDPSRWLTPGQQDSLDVHLAVETWARSHADALIAEASGGNAGDAR